MEIDLPRIRGNQNSVEKWISMPGLDPFWNTYSPWTNRRQLKGKQRKYGFYHGGTETQSFYNFTE